MPKSEPFPSVAEVHQIQALFLSRQWSRLESKARDLTRRYPRHPAGWHALGLALAAIRKPAQAAFALSKAAAVSPPDPAVLLELAHAFRDLGRMDDAINLYAKVLQLAPAATDALFNIAVALQSTWRLDEAITRYKEFLRIEPASPDGFLNLALALENAGLSEEAFVRYAQALSLSPADARVLNNIGLLLQLQGRPEAAFSLYARSHRVQPDFEPAVFNLGNTEKELGYYDDAIICYERALCLSPQNHRAYHNLILLMHYHYKHYQVEHLNAAKRYAVLVQPPSKSLPYANIKNCGRRLKIGYVSSDLRQHPVAFFLSPVLEAHDRTAVEICCYSNSTVRDEWTVRLEALSDEWRSIASLSDADAESIIRRDGVDVLVDLTGHTGYPRLSLFARRPAPVQLAWLGYWGTTGLSAVDAVLMDEVTVPPGNEGWFTEDVIRLPGGRFCYAAPADAPAVEPPPLCRNNTVTFGSFNNPVKFTSTVYSAWARILKAIPGARLLLKWGKFSSDAERSKTAAFFVAAGGDASRLEFRPFSPHPEMLAQYADVDIALDPFPFSGGITSYEAMWMGVPVVTLPGAQPVSRQTLGLLTAISLESTFAADSVDAYVRIATDLAASPAMLAELRSSLRDRMRVSPACDGIRLARALEAVYVERWSKWCRA